MADTKVSALTAASAADGSELLHVVQTGNDRKMTTAQIAALVTSEVIDDRVAALLVAGANITLTYNDAAGTLTIASTGGAGVTDEQIDDRVAALLVAGTNITLTYNDVANTLTIASTGGGGSAGTPFVNGTTTAFTPDLSQANSVIRANNSAAITVTVPTNASVAYPNGTTLAFRQVSSGQITVSPASGVTINKPVSLAYKTREQGSSIMLHKVGTDEWDITGDLAAL